MHKFTKKLVLVILALTLTFSLFACVTQRGGAYKITVEKTENGSLTASKSTANEGDSVTLTATPDQGYSLLSITLNGEPLQINGNGASFTMPNSNVTVKATFEKDAYNGVVVENMPTVRAFDIEAPAVRTPAQGGWTHEFLQTGLKISVWVQDAHLFENEDGVKVYFGVVGYDRALGENNLMVQVLANGSLTTYKVENGEFVQATVEGITAYAQPWKTSENEQEVGFKITIIANYGSLGVTADTAKGKITMLPSHTNCNQSGYATKQTILAGDVYDIEKPNTYPVLTGDSEYQENALATVTAQLGSNGGLEMGVYWNNEQDYFPEESEYENRKVVLSGNDNADNNIYFYNTHGAKQMYAEATFKVTNIYSNEKYGKFGLMFFNGSSRNGLFFYADAYVGEQTVNVNNIVGTELGYNHALNGWTNWNTIADTQGSFNKENKTITLKMAFKDNKLYLYCGDNFIMARDYVSGANALIGIKSFAYGLEVTNYYSTTDATDPKLIAHTPEDTSRAVNLLFVGDNYLASWSGYKSLIVEGGKANESTANETLTTLTQKAQSLKENYKPQNIVLSAGISDINGGTTVETAYTRAQELINAYHQAFPTAKLYYFSLIPSPAQQSKASAVTQFNQKISDLAKEDNLLEFINAEPYFKANGEIRANLFASNGATLNSEYGYPLIGMAITNALGLERAQGNELGDNAEGYAYSDGWSFEDNGAVAVNHGTAEQVIWVKDISYSADLYVEAEIRATVNTGTDAFPKAGLVLRNDRYTIFGYADLAGNPTEEAFMNLVYRPNTGSYSSTGDWLWNEQGSGSYGPSMVSGFVKIAVAKIDSTVYMLCNDVIVATINVPGVLSNDEFIVGALNFNRKMEVKNISVITDRIQVANKLNVEVLPEVSLQDATLLGGSTGEHNPENLTYNVTTYSKTVTVNENLTYARLYAYKTGEYVITVNGSEIKGLPVIMQKNGGITYVHNLGELQKGENVISIITADKNTKIKAKIVLGYGENEVVVSTDNTWTQTDKNVTLNDKPTYYFLGSSVTYGATTNGYSFVEQVEKTLGYNVLKEAVSGTTLVDNGASSYIARMKTLPTESAVNRLIVQLSTNDVTQNLAFGTLSNSVNISDLDTSTVIGAIEYIIAYAKQTWNCEVVFYTNPHYNNNRYNALVNELYKVQAKWGIGILDFYNYVEMEELDSATLNSYMSDDIHPDAQGYEWMGEIFSEYLQNTFEKDVIRISLAK